MQPTHSFSTMLTAEKWGLGQTLSYIPAPTHKHPDIHTHTHIDTQGATSRDECVNINNLEGFYVWL